MKCPFFIDFVRECVQEIDLVPMVNTTLLCSTERYPECPFYVTLKKTGPVCEMVSQCIMFKKISIEDFSFFIDMTKAYCLSHNNVSCERYKMKKSGSVPPFSLTPDGTTIDL
jgi:hypothetical protein